MTCKISPFSSYSILHVFSVIRFRNYDDEFKNKKIRSSEPGAFSFTIISSEVEVAARSGL